MPEKNNAQLQAEQEALYLQQQEEARKQAAQNAQTQVATPTTQGVQRIEGDFGGQEAFKVKGRPVDYGSKTVVINQKVLDEDLSRDAVPGGWKLPPSIPEEQVGRLFSPIAGEKPKVDQAKLDRLARMGRINEAGRVVGVAADVLGLGLGANVNKRPTDDLAAKLFDENDNVYKKLDDDKNKYRDRVAKWMNGRAAQPVYKTVTTTEKTNDIRETEDVLLKTKPKDAAGGGKDNTFNIYDADGNVVAQTKLDKAMKAVSMMEQDPNISAADAKSVRLMNQKMATGNIDTQGIFYLTQSLSLKYPSVRRLFGISENKAESINGPAIPRADVKIGDKSYTATAPLTNNDQREAISVQNKINQVAGNEPDVPVMFGNMEFSIPAKDYAQARNEVLTDPANSLEKDEDKLHALTVEKIKNGMIQSSMKESDKQNQKPKPAAKITATGNDARQF